MIGQDFERSMVRAFNDYASASCTRLVAYRHYQMRFQPQLFDVLVDSGDPDFYLAFECKSIDPNTVSNLYFKKSFNWQGGVCQVVRENDWLTLSGRVGYLVVELRRKRPSKTACYFIPWSFVVSEFHKGVPCLYSDDILSQPSCVKSAGKYLFDDKFFDSLWSGAD